jgi:NAD(P)-dependent dehydrogenase (short-subunit alcohol dehydrogenase family)
MGRKALPLQLDVRDFDSIQQMVEEAWRHYGQIEILVNNAGCSATPGWHLTAPAGAVSNS